MKPAIQDPRQLDIFGVIAPGTQLPSAPVDTSEDAALSMVVNAGTLRARVLSAVRAAGRGGLTIDEFEHATGLKHQTASARFWELEKLKVIIPTDTRRNTRSGRRARAYVAVAP